MSGEPLRRILPGPLYIPPSVHLPPMKLERVHYKVQMVEEGPDLYAVCIPELTFGEDERPELYLIRYPEFLRMGNLFVPTVVRRKGLARLMVMAALSCANKVRLPVYLDVMPFAGRPVDFPALFAFYESCGFRRFPGHPTAMVYEMNAAAPAVGEPWPAEPALAEAST